MCYSAVSCIACGAYPRRGKGPRSKESRVYTCWKCGARTIIQPYPRGYGMEPVPRWWYQPLGAADVGKVVPMRDIRNVHDTTDGWSRELTGTVMAVTAKHVHVRVHLPDGDREAKVSRKTGVEPGAYGARWFEGKWFAIDGGVAEEQIAGLTPWPTARGATRPAETPRSPSPAAG